jgi:hypothetical protein
MEGAALKIQSPMVGFGMVLSIISWRFYESINWSRALVWPSFSIISSLNLTTEAIASSPPKLFFNVLIVD